MLKSHTAEGRLKVYEPLFPGDPMIRALYLTPSVCSLLEGHTKAEAKKGSIQSIMDQFVSGRVVSVGHNRKCHMSLLKPQRDGIWDMRVATPLPAIRIFGQFAEQDVFIALSWEYRGLLGRAISRPWKTEIRRCKAEWRKLFPTYNSMKGESIHEYLTDAHSE